MIPESEELLIAAWDDWVSLGEARYIVAKHHPDTAASVLREQTLALVESLLTRDLVDVGDVTTSFEPWRIDTVGAMSRIREEWSDPNDRLLPGDVCWLAITSAGNRIADEALRE